MSKIKILIPIYNDWRSLYELLRNIDNEIKESQHQFSVIIVNDASSEKDSLKIFSSKKIDSIKVINMKKNQGHARCIATGLRYIYEKEEFDYVIPMDGDGEDRPEEINLLLDKIDDNINIPITANRVKRSEGIIFKFCYSIHKFLTFAFTSQSIKFGNFTCLSKSVVSQIILDSSLWNSFSGTIASLFKDRVSVPSIRGKRYFGPSKMSFFNLLFHSLSIISVFKVTVLTRCLIFLIVYLLLISKNLSLVTSIPVFLIFMFVISILAAGKRENISELEESLSNISNIDQIR
tara:strand:- start:1326 stop:2198 length:873 start_codon:yes stop_codon:yes gene_type:complete